MSLTDWLEKRKAELEKGKVVTMQRQAERQRKKQAKARYIEPGTIAYGLMNRQDPMTFMKEAYERRKQNRQNKN